jgi:Rrf2 family protein
MKITKKGEYSLKALLALTVVHRARTLSIREIARQEKLPRKYLEQIMMILRKNGFVESVKGNQGGYSLSRDPQDITIGEIIRAVEGPLAPIANAREIEKRIQRNERHAGLYCFLLDVRNAVSEILDKRTLADLCEKSAELCRSDSSKMYYI